MKIRTIIMFLTTGMSCGVVMSSSFVQLGLRVSAVGGEVFFMPMVVLLVWLGWMLNGEYRKAAGGRRTRKTKKQG